MLSYTVRKGIPAHTEAKRTLEGQWRPIAILGFTGANGKHIYLKIRTITEFLIGYLVIAVFKTRHPIQDGTSMEFHNKYCLTSRKPILMVL